MDMIEQISKIVKDHNDDSRVLESQASSDPGAGCLFARLERSAQNQCIESNSMFSRYGIWANTMRGNLIDALNDLEGQDSETAVRRITECINSLSAFAEIQTLLERPE